MLILFGTGKSTIRHESHNDVICPNCQQKCQHRITIEGVYFNLFFIPIVPLTRNIYSECEYCGVKLKESDWSDALKVKFYNGLQAHPAKRPIWHYFGCLSIFFIIALFVILAVYVAITKDTSSNIQEDYIENIEDTEPSIENKIESFEDSITPKIESATIEEEYEEIKPTDSIQSFF